MNLNYSNFLVYFPGLVETVFETGAVLRDNPHGESGTLPAFNVYGLGNPP